MILPVFKRSDFELCSVKTPHGYPQSQTHAGVAVYDGKFYLTCSPYPAKKCSKFKSYWMVFLQKVSHGRIGKTIDAEKYENPMLYIGEVQGVCPPVRFESVQPFPLMKTPTPVFGQPAYNSDPDIFIDDGRVYILNRTYYRKPSICGVAGKEVLISLINGNIDKAGFHFTSIEDLKRSSKSLISPCLIKYKGEFLFSFLETNSAIDGRTFDGLYIQRAKTIAELKDNDIYSEIEVLSNGLLPWHMSLFAYNGQLYSIIACVRKGDTSHIWQMLGEFNDNLTQLKIYPRPLTDYNSYRGAAAVVEDDFILYSATLNEKVRGSKSIDGRDIIVAKVSMEQLFKTISL